MTWFYLVGPLIVFAALLGYEVFVVVRRKIIARRYRRVQDSMRIRTP